MVRTIFLTLVLLNLVVLAWIYLMGDARNNAGHEPERNKAQMATDKIRLLPLEDVALSAGAGSVQVSATVAGEVCQAYAGATINEAQQIVKTLTEKSPLVRVVANPVAPPSTFELLIPGLASRALAETKLLELKKLGITDGVQIRADDDKHFSLLIASYGDRAGAEEALKAVSKKGVRSAVAGEHKADPEKALIEVRGNDAALKKLPEQLVAFKMLSPAACPAR